MSKFCLNFILKILQYSLTLDKLYYTIYLTCIVRRGGISKNQNYIKFFAILLLVLSFVVFSTFTFADVGNINRYDNSSSSSGSSYSGSYSSSSSSGSGSLVPLIIIGVVFVIFLYLYGKSKGKITSIKDLTDLNKVKDVYKDMTSGIGGNTKQIAEEIRTTDPNFSEDKFLSWARDVFLKIQQAWTKRDWKVIRPFESNELFEQHNAQLQEYINNNQINVIERININAAEIIAHRFDGDKEIIEVALSAIMNDYIIDATTKQVVKGDKNKDWTMKYKLTFARKNGVKTVVGTSNISTTNCPNCGAPTQITSAGQCEYCGSVITTGDHDFVLTNIEGLR